MSSLASPPAGTGWKEGTSGTAAVVRYYRTVRSHIRLIVACVVVTLAAAAAYVELAPRTYVADAQLLVNPASTQDTVLFSLPVLHSSGDPTQDVLTAAGLIKTPQVASATIAALHLRMAPTVLLGKIQATPLDQSNIVALQATAGTPRQAERIANTFAAETVAVRTAALHQAITAIIPGLTTTVARLPAADRSGPGTLGDQLNQLEQLESAPDPTISVAAPATLPSSPASPHTGLSLAIGLFAGLLIGLGAAFAFDALDPHLQREPQLGERFNTPVLARIPDMPKPRKSGPLTPLDLPFPALEQYRTLRATLTARALGQPQAYLLTGSAPSEGKTTSAINLATALAQSGDRVILIEADLHRPVIAAALGLTRFRSTEDVISGQTDLASALTKVKLTSSDLLVLAARGNSTVEANRLSAATAQRLVDQAKSMAQYVVIDSPPITAVVDALPFAKVSDAVLVTARIGHSRLSKLAELWELLGHQGALPTGVVLVGVPEQRLDYGYGYYSSSHSSDAEPAPEANGSRRSLRPAATRTPRP